MPAAKLSFRLDDELVDVLDELSRRARLDTSSTLRELIRLAGSAEGLWPPPMPTELEVVALLAEKARAGSVTATIVLLKHLASSTDPHNGSGALDALDAGPSMIERLADRKASRNGRNPHDQ